MKNSSKLLALGLVLFLGACSATEGDFLKKVEGKTAYSDGAYTQEMFAFSSDGKSYGDGENSPKFTFVEASDADTATYTFSEDGQNMTMTIKTTDGKTGSMGDSTDSQPIYLKVK